MLIDLSKPWCIAEHAVKPYLRQYQHVLTAKANGADIRSYEPVEGMEQVMPKAIGFYTGTEPFEGAGFTLQDDVATIDIRGPIVRYGGMLCSLSGMTSTQDILTSVGNAFDHSAVTAIVLNIDSPGGEVTSLAEAADMIYSLRGQGKPIIAYADGACCSAAYWLASACDMVVAANNSMVGSIGCIMCIVEDDKAMEMQGLQEFEYVSSQSPNKNPEPGTENGDSAIQTLVDDNAQVFIDAVARYRGITPEDVVKNYGGGGVFIGKKAVAAGLADMIGDYDSLVEDLSNGVMPSAKQSLGEKIMSVFKKTGDAPEIEAAATVTGVSTEAFQQLQAQLEAANKRAVDAEAVAVQIKAAGRDKAVTDFMASVKPKVAPAATDVLKAIAVSAYDGTPVSLEALSAFFENMQAHGAMAEVPLDEAKNITAVDNPENAAAVNAVDDAAVQAALKKAGIKETK